MNFRPEGALICSRCAPDFSEWCPPAVSSWRNPELSLTLPSPCPLPLPHTVWSPVLSSSPLSRSHVSCFPPLDERRHPSYLLIFAWFTSTSSFLPDLSCPFHVIASPGVLLHPGGDGEAFYQPDQGRAGGARPRAGQAPAGSLSKESPYAFIGNLYSVCIMCRQCSRPWRLRAECKTLLGLTLLWTHVYENQAPGQRDLLPSPPLPHSERKADANQRAGGSSSGRRDSTWPQGQRRGTLPAVTQMPPGWLGLVLEAVREEE